MAPEPGTEPTTETLSDPPTLGAVFARAALGSILGGSSKGSSSTSGEAKGGGGAATLPDTRLALAGRQVDRGHLMAYQRLCRFGVDDVLPHTYPHVLGFPLQAELMSRKAFPLPLVGLVHIENVITVHRRLTADDALDITVHARNLQPHPKGRQVELVTEVDVEGERVWEGRSTYLARGRTGGEADAGQERPAPPALPTGFPAAQWRLPGDLGRRYGAVSGDVNPIHISAVTAKAMGFPKAIAHGMWTYARTLAALGRESEGPSTSQVWFKKPVLLPGRVDLVVDPSGEATVAGLRHSRKTATEHLVLTLETAA